jgi:hypothetical protein
MVLKNVGANILFFLCKLNMASEGRAKEERRKSEGRVKEGRRKEEGRPKEERRKKEGRARMEK